MNEIRIDETKLGKAMEIIEKAASLMEERDCGQDKEAGEELAGLQNDLRELSGNERLRITDFQRYWSYTSLETMARKALMAPPSKNNVTNEEIKEIVLGLLKHSEAEMDWWLEYLKINTGLANLTDYIFYPNLVGLGLHATLEQIADKIIADRKSQSVAL